MTEPLTPASRRVAFTLALLRRRTRSNLWWRPPAVTRHALQAGKRAALAVEVAARRRTLEPRYRPGAVGPEYVGTARWPLVREAPAAQPDLGPARLGRTVDPARPVEPPGPAGHAAAAETRPSVPQASPTHPAPAEPPPVVLRAGSMPLPLRTQARLARLLHVRIPAVRLHVGLAADAVLRNHRADALTFGRHILVRTDRYAPDRIAGLALLGHEVTHAAHNSDTAGRPRAPRDDEAAALGVEQRLPRAADAVALPPPPSGPAASLPGPAVASPIAGPPVAAVPQAAPTGRTLGGAHQGADVAPALSGPQLRRLTDHVYRDIMSRIRTEFERGG